MTALPEATGDTSSKIGLLVKAMTKSGPHINRIAAELGINKETARYWYKQILLKKGYTVQAVPNHERLGLSRAVARVEFSDEFRPCADAILKAMSELCYLTSFARTLPDDLYSIHASVPREHSNEWIEFMYELMERGVFSSIEAVPFEWVRVVPMRSEMYNFQMDSWEYDWKSRPKIESGFSTDFAPSPKCKFDFIDLNIIKQLQLDPDGSLTDAQRKLQANYKTLTWHYRTHLVGNGLLKGYLVNWAGGRYDPQLDKARHKRHRYAWVELLVRGVTETERMELAAKVNRLPFVWLEAGGMQNYLAQIAFPIETIAEALEFIKEVIWPVRQKASWHFLDQTNALRFTITPKLYDPVGGKWNFDKAELLSRFERLVIEIKKTTS